MTNLNKSIIKQTPKHKNDLKLFISCFLEILVYKRRNRYNVKNALTNCMKTKTNGIGVKVIITKIKANIF